MMPMLQDVSLNNKYIGGFMSKSLVIKWLSEPEEKDYPAAESYLSLIYGETTVKTIISELQSSPTKHFKAKDIFRASELSLLGISNYHVEKDRKKIEEGKQLSPILLVRDGHNGKVIIADGYHRLCAVYSFNEDEKIPCKIVQR
jgi:hypothetical protein